MKRIVALLTLVACVLALLALGACGETKPTDDTITVTFYHTMGANLRAVLDKYIAKFNEQYPNIIIDHQQIGSYDDVRDQIITELQAGAQPAFLSHCLHAPFFCAFRNSLARCR